MLISILYSAWRYSEERSQRQNDLEQEYRSAQELQQVLIPDTFPSLPGYSVASVYRPAQEVGGDFFQILPLPEGAALIVIGDVSGKGLPAAMAVALLVGAIRSTAETTSSPAELLAALNRRLYGRLRGGFATCLGLHLDAHGTLTLSNAGHLEPYRNGKEAPLDIGLPLGIVPDASYSESTLRLAPGDTLTLLTDGVVEARNHAGEIFGFERTASISNEPAGVIAHAAKAFGQEDDITVLTVTRHATAWQPAREPADPVLKPS
jgi:serine phosphatase RsbU (regulator of sigma subunit)